MHCEKVDKYCVGNALASESLERLESKIRYKELMRGCRDSADFKSKTVKLPEPRQIAQKRPCLSYERAPKLGNGEIDGYGTQFLQVFRLLP